MPNRVPSDIQELHDSIPDHLFPGRKKTTEQTRINEARDRGEIDAAEAARRRAIVRAARPHVWANDEGELASAYDEDHTIPVYM